MKIEHSVTKVGKLQKIEVLLKDDYGKPIDAELSMIINPPDGLEIIYLPANTLEGEDKGIYAHGKGVSDTFVSRVGKGKYQVTFAPDAKGEHECVVVLIGKDIEDHKFRFTP